MRSSSSSVVVSLLALAIAACGSWGSADPPGAAPGPNDQPGGPDGTPPPAPPVGTDPIDDQLNETFGIFVATTGADNADGTRAHPLARIQPAIDLAHKVGKRVYVCTGTYREALVLSDSNSIIGGLSCTAGDGWRTGAPHSRVESPTIPAILAKNIVTSTHVEALDVVAPTATGAGASSVALLADHAGALIFKSSRIVAGDASKGDDGTNGIQLVQAAAAIGGAVVAPAECVNNATCKKSLAPPPDDWFLPTSGLGGTNVCEGAPGHVAEAGGFGGGGGLWEVYLNVGIALRVYRPDAGARSGSQAGGSLAGAHGQGGANAPLLGKFSKDGYEPAPGLAGSDGSPGRGGAGGDGDAPPAPPSGVGSVWRGFGGAGGGAGGCPGLAGTSGQGGGASIAALLVESPVVFDSTELVSGRGGAPGNGAFSSLPSAGGKPGLNPQPVAYPLQSGHPGGRGGVGGVSGNGSSGPSIGVAHIGLPPKVVGATKIAAGAGGAAVPERTRDMLVVVSTIPATPAGLSKDILAL